MEILYRLASQSFPFFVLNQESTPRQANAPTAKKTMNTSISQYFKILYPINAINDVKNKPNITRSA